MPTPDAALAFALAQARIALDALEAIPAEIVPSRTSAVFDARDALTMAHLHAGYLVRKLETAREHEGAMAAARAETTKGRKR